MINENVLLRLYMRSADLQNSAPAYERIVQQSARNKLAGATVLRGIMGFGSRGLVKSSDYRLIGDSPVIVELVDSGEKLLPFLAAIAAAMHHGLATLERAAVLMYRPRNWAASQKTQLLSGVKPLSTLPDTRGVLPMHTDSVGVLLRIFIGESDTYNHKPLHEAIVAKARELGLAGATVLQGSMGFGANSVMHTDKILVMSSDLPIVIELVDTREQIEKLLPALDGMVAEGMITMEEVKIIAYRHDPADQARKQSGG